MGEINVQSKASRNQLNLPHGTKTNPEILKKNGEQPESVVSVREKEGGYGGYRNNESIKMFLRSELLTS